jgi:hypothetical protein
MFAPTAHSDTKLDISDPVTFFTNLASRLLRSELNLSLTNIQIYPTNQYTPAVHRLLQVTANIYDAATNRVDRGGTNFPYLPTVFRPTFEKRGNAVYISGYAEFTDGTNWVSRPRDLENPADVAALQSNDNVYGIPWIIGAKKGFPNFNEFAMQSVFQITRKLQVHRDTVSSPRSSFRTNEMFVIGISNVIGGEVWNSYRSNYTHPVDIIVADDMSIALTNEFGMNLSQRLDLANLIRIPSTTNTTWPGWSYRQTDTSFIVALRTNFIFLPDSVYLAAANAFSSNLQTSFDDPQLGSGFRAPNWYLAVTNRVRVIILDRDTRRLVDFVLLAGLDGIRNLSGEIRTPDHALGFAGLWSTNRQGGQGINFPPIGVVNQVQISLGNYNASAVDWRDYGVNQPTSPRKEEEIDKFRAFFGLNPLWYPGTVNTNLNAQVPFTPTRRVSQHLTWQANDPLVHYLSSDLLWLDITNNLRIENLNLPVETLENIGRLNNRFEPWGGNPVVSPIIDFTAFMAAVKDPLVYESDDWAFPDSIGFTTYGRIHRGTPWQTLYLKSAGVDLQTWKKLTGVSNDNEARLTMPTNDWHLAELLAPLLNTNSPGQLLSANDKGIDSWLGALNSTFVLTNVESDDALIMQQLQRPVPLPDIDEVVMTSNSPQAFLITDAIQATRAAQPAGIFRRLSDLLSTPELSLASPWLNRSTDVQRTFGISDEAYERIPAQLLQRLRPDSIGTILSASETVTVRFAGLEGYPYAIEVSSNLVNWVRLNTNYPTGGSFELTQPTASGPQFFRSVLLP